MLNRLLAFYGYDRRSARRDIRHHAGIFLRLSLLAAGVFAVALAYGGH